MRGIRRAGAILVIVFSASALMSVFGSQVSGGWLFLLKLGILLSVFVGTCTLVLPVVLDRTQVRDTMRAVVLLMLSIGICMVVGEITTRVLFKNITTTGDNGSYFAQRWYASSSPVYNELGFVEKEITSEQTPGVYRIAVIGDSITFGQGVERQERLTEQLADQLLRMVPNTEILNFGRPGAETINHVETLSEVVLPLNPNFVLMQWFTNDVEGVDKSARPTPWRLVPSDYLSSWLYIHSGLYYLVNRQWVILQERSGLLESYGDYMERRFRPADAPDMIAATEALREFIKTAREASVGLGIVMYPRLERDGSARAFSMAFLMERVLAVCAEEEVACVDLRSAFAGVYPTERLRVNVLDGHPSAEAHALASQALVERFGDDWRYEANELVRTALTSTVVVAPSP